MKEKQLNPYEYGYKPGEKVEIEGGFLTHLMSFINKITEENTKYFQNDKFKFINKESNKTVKNPKKEDLESGKVIKIVDVEASLNSQAKAYRTPTALQAINLSLMLQDIHLKAIDEGKAMHYTEFEKQEKKEEPKLIIEP